MLPANKVLGTKIAANAVSATLTSFIAVPLVLLSSPAYAYPVPNSQQEYEQYVYEATTIVNQARSALNAENVKLDDNVTLLGNLIAALDEAEGSLRLAEENTSWAQGEYATAQQELATAQYNYDTLLIPETGEPAGVRVPGLKVDIYNLDPNGRNIPAMDAGATLCKTTTFTQINNNWGGGDIEGCGNDFVMIHYTGYLTVPDETQLGYDFLGIADDGWYMTLDGVVVNDNWTLKGCGGWWSEKQHLTAGRSYALDAWYYEWTGGACSTLYYDNGQNWGVIPAAWYSQNEVAPVVYVHDPALLVILEEKQAAYDTAAELLEQANISQQDAKTSRDGVQEQKVNAITEQEVIRANIEGLQGDLETAIYDLETIPVYVPPAEPPAPEITPEPSPEATPEVIPEVTPEPTQAEVLDALWEQATQDDIVVDEQLAAIPVLGAAIVAVTDAINYLGNVGSDMTPEVREKSKKVIVSAVIVTQIAAQAAVTATMAASAAGGTTTGRRE